jgi:hypothetical protein
MAVQQLASLTLSDDERSELQSLTMRRKTAQALALRARIVLAVQKAARTQRWRPSWA